MGDDDTRIREVERTMRELTDEVSDQRVRLEKGAETFAHHRYRLETLEERTKPKGVPWLKLLLASAGFFVTCAGALWFLSVQLSDRPTTQQLEKTFDQHEDAGHREFRKELTVVRENLVEQRVLINEVKQVQNQARATQKSIDSKLDRLLRTSRPRGPAQDP